MPTKKLPPGVPARWPLAVTAPWLRRPGHYHLVVCARRPFVRTFKSSDMEKLYAYEKERGGDWITTVYLDTTHRNTPPALKPDWSTRQEICQYPGTCFVCRRPFNRGSDVVVVHDDAADPGSREGWAHSGCAREAESRG